MGNEIYPDEGFRNHGHNLNDLVLNRKSVRKDFVSTLLIFTKTHHGGDTYIGLLFKLTDFLKTVACLNKLNIN